MDEDGKVFLLFDEIDVPMLDYKYVGESLAQAE